MAWYSIDTGPSVFINTYRANTETIVEVFLKMGFENVLVSDIGEEPFPTNQHLFLDFNLFRFLLFKRS